jgi:hypothetical protein
MIKSKDLKYKAKLGICCSHEGDTPTLNKIYGMVLFFFSFPIVRER